LAACATGRESGRLERFEFSRPEMGLPFRMALYAPDRQTAETAAHAAFGRVRELNNVFTDYDSDSELSRLSQTSGQGRAVRVSEDLWLVLSRAQALAARSGGAFDITVGPYVNLWRKARRDRELPTQERLARARAAVGYQYLRLEARHRTAELLVPNMRLDLGGIAKGYALDEALRVLGRHGIRSALVSGGGDMVASGAPPGKRGWRIEVAPLDTPDAPPSEFVWLADRALATSGDLFQRLEIAGRRYSHIVDPRTGVGLTDHSLVTIIAPDGTTADSLATAVSVLGPTAGLRLVNATRGAAAHLVRQPGTALEVRVTRTFRRYFADGGDQGIEGSR
jgi:thiamine biosynthesis lipoprotein